MDLLNMIQNLYARSPFPGALSDTEEILTFPNAKTNGSEVI